MSNLPGRVQVICDIARRIGARTYLEVGVDDPSVCFEHVPAARKWGVDPNGRGTHTAKSDDFFAALGPHERFDLVFVDGYHEASQATRDAMSALRHLEVGGVLVMHDCMPPTDEYERHSYLCGTVWRSFVELRSFPFVDAACGNFDFGVGVVRCRTNTDRLALGKRRDELNFGDLMANRAGLLRLMEHDALVDFATRR